MAPFIGKSRIVKSLDKLVGGKKGRIIIIMRTEEFEVSF